MNTVIFTAFNWAHKTPYIAPIYWFNNQFMPFLKNNKIEHTRYKSLKYNDWSEEEYNHFFNTPKNHCEEWSPGSTKNKLIRCVAIKEKLDVSLILLVFGDYFEKETEGGGHTTYSCCNPIHNILSRL